MAEIAIEALCVESYYRKKVLVYARQLSSLGVKTYIIIQCWHNVYLMQ